MCSKPFLKPYFNSNANTISQNIISSFILQENEKRNKWYFFTKTFRTYCEKKNVLVIKKNFGNSRLKAKNLEMFEITRTIYSNSERTEQLLVTEIFFNLFLEVSKV